MTQPGQSISVRLRMDIAEWISGARRVTAETARMASEGKRNMNELGSAIDKAARAEKLDNVAHAATGVGIALGGAFAYIVAQAASFEKAMSEVNSVTDAGSRDLQKLEQAALKAGAATQYSATQAAKAEAELLRAGLSVQDVLSGALGGALSLAAAGQLDLEEAATVTAKALNTFDLSGADSTHIADVLAASANKSATNVHEMGIALKQGGLAANQMGVSLEETAGTLALFAQNALAGSDGGTSFKTMLQFLAAPSDKAKAKMEELGIAAFDSGGKFVGVAALADNLQKSLGGLTQAEQANALATIFGADASRAANILLKEGGAEVRKFTAAVDDQGAAARTAAEMTDNLSGDFERLKGSVDTFAIESGGGGAEGLRVLAQAAKLLVDEVSQLPPVLTGGATVLIGLGAAGLLAFAGFVKARGAITGALEELRATGPAGIRAADGLEKASKKAKVAAGAFIALELAGAVFDSFRRDAANVDLLADSLSRFARTGQVSGEITRVFGKDLVNFATSAKFAGEGFGNEFSRFGESLPGVGSAIAFFGEQINGTSFTGAADDVKALDQAMANYINTSGDSVAANDVYRKAFEASGLTLAEFKERVPEASAALEHLQQVAQGTVPETDKLGASVTEMGGEAAKASGDVQKLQDAIDKLFNAQLDADRALIKYKQGIRDLKKELSTGKKTLSLDGKDGEEGGKNRSAILDQIENINKLRDARIDEGKSVESSNAIYKTQLESLRKSAIAAGFNKDQVNELVNKYKEIPGQVVTDVVANGIPEASDNSVNLLKHLQAIPENQTFTFNGETMVDAQGKATDLGFQLKGLPAGASFAFDGTSIVDATGKVYTLDEAINGVPGKKNVQFTVRTSGIGDLKYVHDTLAGLSDKTVNVAMKVTGTSNVSAARAAIGKQYATPYGYDQGGIRSYAAGGVDPGIYTGVGDGMIKFAEASTIKEGYLPYSQRGTQRNRAILAEMASWEKMRLIPMARGGITAAANGLVTSGGTEAMSGSRADFNRAQLSGLDSLKSLTDALKENGKAFSMNTQKGRDNQKAVASLLDSAKSAAEAKYAETGSYVQANRVYDQYIARLEKILRIRGASAAQAKRLVRDLQNRPEYAAPEAAKPKTGFDYASYTSALGGAEESIGSLQDTLSLNKATLSYKDPAGRDNFAAITNAIKSASDAANERYALTGDLKSSRKIFNDYIAQLRKSLLSAGFSSAVASSIIKRYAKDVNVTKNALGGLYPDDAGVYSGGATIHGFAEQSTGRELFLPKQGISQQKAARLLQVGAGWHGMDVSPRGTGSGSSTSNTYHLNLNPRTANMTARDLRPVIRDIEISSRVGWPK